MNNCLILVAGDKGDDRELLNDAFKQAGYSGIIEFFHDGLELVSFVKTLSMERTLSVPIPSLILLDLDMPLKSGSQVLWELKRSAQYNIIPIIVFSTTADPEVIEYCYEAGANSYIIKPQKYDDLVRHINTFVSYWLSTAQIVPLNTITL